jgi:regulation of enolase protein 1 (concanavalin A-like superfamily)
VFFDPASFMKPPTAFVRRHHRWKRICTGAALLAGLSPVSRAGYIAGLDGASAASTFETGSIALLPQSGWSNVTGAARIFDLAGAFNGTVIATTPFGAYTVEYTPPQAVVLLPHTRYVLHFDLGFVAGNVGGSADYSFQLGTVTAGAFTGLGSPVSGTLMRLGNMGQGVFSGSAEQEFNTGGTPPPGDLSIRWSLLSYNGNSDFFGFDNVTLEAVPLVPDGIPPAIVSAGSLNGATIGLVFSEPVDKVSAENPSSYAVSGVSVVSAVLQPDRRTVVLIVTGLSAPDFSISAGGVKDVSSTPAAPTAVAGTVTYMAAADVGLPAETGSAYSTGPGAITMHAGGYDVWSNSDSCFFASVEKTGDFDLRVRVANFSPAVAHNLAKALFMVRETADAESRHVSVTVHPQSKIWSAMKRDQIFGATSALSGNASVNWPAGSNYPDIWMRIRRSGGTFAAFGSTNGEAWIPVGDPYTPGVPFADTLLVGMAACSVQEQFAGSPPVDVAFQNFGNFQVLNTAVNFQEHPASTTVTENTQAVFRAAATVTGTAQENLAWQWLRNGDVIPGATSATYIMPSAPRTDDGARFRARAYVPGGDSKLSNEALLTVNPDTVPPVPLSAVSLGGTSIIIRFSEILDPLTAAAAAHYTLPGGGVVQEAALLADGKSVRLMVSGLSGSPFQLGIAGVKDAALNTMNATVSGQILPWVSEDIGTMPLPSTVNASAADAFDVSAAGADIWGFQDAFHFIHQPRTGDFDVRVQMTRLDFVNFSTRGGLMVRESSDPGSRNFFVGTYPTPDGDNHWVSTVRPETGGDTSLAPGDSYIVRAADFAWPHVWFRLMRAGNTFTAFYGTNGTEWTQIGDQYSPAVPWPHPVHLGLATASINASTQTTAHYRNFGDTTSRTADLTIDRTAEGVNLSWSETAAGFLLYHSTDLIAGNWHIVSVTPGISGGRFHVTLSPDASRDFFRLQK